MSAPSNRLDIAVGTRLLTEHSSPALSSLLAASVISAILSAVAAVTYPSLFAHAWLWAFYCYFPIVIGALYWILLHFICDSNWSVIPRRIWENMVHLSWLMIPFFAVFFVVDAPKGIAHYVWQWIGADDPELSEHYRNLYLNKESFLIRAGIYFAFFIGVSLYYRSQSVKQDESGHPMFTVLMRRYACPLMCLWALAETFSSVDWLMGIDYKWTSSLFGVYGFAVSAQASLAATIVLLAMFRAKGYYDVLNAEHFHLMGKLLFGFTIFWAYIAFGQFLLDWYANIPEETIFYNDHNRGGWIYVTYLIIVGKFILPVLLLLPQETKKNFHALTKIAGLILVMHFIEMFWLIMPYSHSHNYWVCCLTFCTVTSILGFFFVRNMSLVPLYPIRDPRLNECLTIKN